jgi:sugar phosphate isomerase/epimerase
VKLAISNIAWDTAADDAMAERMRALGAGGVELAPPKCFKDLAAATRAEADGVRAAWKKRGFDIVATQALWFGRPELKVFGTPQERATAQAYLIHVLQIGAWLGAKAQVFGSPKNRLKGELSWTQALASGAEFFKPVAEAAAKMGTCLAFEPNPTAYACDFGINAAEGEALVAAVAHPGMKLHLDAAGMFLAGDDGVACARRLGAQLVHFHLSAPNLAPVTPDAGPDYPGLIRALHEAGYQGCLSIEMRQHEGNGVAAAAAALAFLAPLATAA